MWSLWRSRSGDRSRAEQLLSRGKGILPNLPELFMTDSFSFTTLLHALQADPERGQVVPTLCRVLFWWRGAACTWRSDGDVGTPGFSSALIIILVESWWSCWTDRRADLC